MLLGSQPVDLKKSWSTYFQEQEVFGGYSSRRNLKLLEETEFIQDLVGLMKKSMAPKQTRIILCYPFI